MSALHTAHDLIHMASSPNIEMSDSEIPAYVLVCPLGMAPAC